MTNDERAVRVQSIIHRQNSGQITTWEASAEMDRLLDETTGDLHYHGDTTGLKDVWNGQPVMVLFRWDHQPSNTGIITQGENRGLVVLKPGETETNALLSHLNHFGRPGDRKSRSVTPMRKYKP